VSFLTIVAVRFAAFFFLASSRKDEKLFPPTDPVGRKSVTGDDSFQSRIIHREARRRYAKNIKLSFSVTYKNI
jgi:hypothetical protein